MEKMVISPEELTALPEDILEEALISYNDYDPQCWNGENKLVKGTDPDEIIFVINGDEYTHNGEILSHPSTEFDYVAYQNKENILLIKTGKDIF